MPRVSYEDSYRALQKRKLVEPGDVPPLRYDPPRHNDETPGLRFFNSMVGRIKLEHLTLPRIFISRSEFRSTSFKGADLSQSIANWNDFIGVNFTEADLSGSDFRACVFNGVKFKNANLAGVDFRYCGFAKCDFTGADVTDMKLAQKAGRSLQLTPDQQSVVDWQADDGEEPEGG